MKVLDVIKESSTYRPHEVYGRIKQPMFTYHSTEELSENEDKYYVVRNVSEFIKVVQKIYDAEKQVKTTGSSTLILNNYNIFIATNEKYIPEKYTEDGESIIYRLNGTKLVPTDNCYIRLCALDTRRNKYITYTSVGMFMVSIKTWNFSAAIKPFFGRIDIRKKNNIYRKEEYESALNEILNSQRTYLDDLRVILSFLHPYSDTFLDEDETIAKVFGNRIRVKDRKKYFESERFSKILMKEMFKIMPKLQDAIQNGIPPKDVTNFLKRIAEKAIENDNVSVDDKLKSVQAIVNMGYPDEAGDMSELPINASPTALIDSKRQEPIPGMLRQRGRKATGIAGRSLYNDEDVDGKPQPDDELTDDDFEKLREETGAIDGYSQKRRYEE